MKKLLPLALVASLPFALAGCGDDGDSEALSGPAGVVPADMPIYIEASIRPEGEQAENLDALLADLGELPIVGSVADPGDFVISQLESEAADAGVDFSYAEDVEPWLGEKAGFGISETEEGETSFVAALETTDEDQARESIQGLLEEDSIPSEEGEYEGVSYFSAPDDSYRLGVFEGHVVLAPAVDFEAAVDASGEDSLATSDKLADSLAQLDEESLASMYIDLEQFATLTSTEADAEELEQAKEVLPELFEGAIAISAGVPSEDQVYLDYSTPLFEGQPDAGGSPLLESAPGDSLGAFALEDVGAFGPAFVDIFERLEEAGADLEDFPAEGIAAAFESETGVAFDDATEAIGDASVWVRGELPDALEVAGEIEVSDTEVATDLIEALEQEVDQEGDAKVGPPVGGSDVGFSASESSSKITTTECSSVGDAAECLPVGGAHADLPFTNIELDGDVIRYGFFTDEEAAASSDPDAEGDFAETEAFAAGQEALGDDFEYVGVLDLAPILDQLVPDPSITDAVMGPAELVAPFVAGKLDLAAFGIRYEDEVSVSRYVLQLAE